jgi:L-iditol 2-dehydrogenase
MKYLVSETQNKVSICETDVPMPGPGELTVRLSLCGVCGTDILKVFGTFARPQKLGHEVVGIVEQVGSGVTEFVPGQCVALAHHAPDANSHYALHGSETMDAQFKASNIFPGGFSEVIRVPADLVPHTVLAIPEHVPDARAVFMEPMACCVRALDRVAPQRGDSALVIGIGAIGMLFVPLLRDLGVTTVVADVRAARIATALSWGAAGGATDGLPELCKKHSEGRGVDHVILTVVNDATVALALECVRDGGRLMIFAAKPEAELKLPIWDIYRREINVLTSYSATPDGLKRAMSLLSSPEFAGLETLISHSLGIEDGQKAFELARDGLASKVVITVAS